MTSHSEEQSLPHRPPARRRLSLPLALGAAAIAYGSSGCATIASGTSERIRFESTPPGAEVRVDGKTYTTPAEVRLSRRQNHDVEFSLPDHEPAKRQVLQSTNGWLYGNILIGGLVGMLIDHSSGAAYDLEPDVVAVELVRQPVATDPSANSAAPSVDSTAEPPGPAGAAP